jgi:hypothetical protein
MEVEVLGVAVAWEGVSVAWEGVVGALLGGEGDGGEKEACTKAILLLV